MFYFRTKLKQSPNHGIGIYADEDIPKDALIWNPSPALSLHWSEEEFNNLPEDDKRVIAHYGYFHKEHKIWHLAADDSRYVNHSKTPTSTVSDDSWGLKAITDLKQGDEITQDYNDFENEEFQRKRGLIK